MNNESIYKILVSKEVIPDTNKYQYTVPCPFHDEINGTSLSINFNKNFFKCFSPKCHNIKGNLTKLVKLLGVDILEETIYNYSRCTEERKVYDNDENEFITFDINRFNQYKESTCNYLLNRGLTQAILKANKCTYSSKYEREYMPIWFKNECYGYCGRTTKDENYRQTIIDFFYKKYGFEEKETIRKINKGIFDEKYPQLAVIKPFQRYHSYFTANRNKIVYEPLTNSDNNDISIVCEGQINALIANKFGVNSFAILGSNPTKIQIDYIMNKTNGNAILFFDNDKAGVENTRVFRKNASCLIPAVAWQGFEQFNDIAELKTQSDFRKLLLQTNYF